MYAGLDFQGAIRQVVSYLEKRNPLRFELEHLLRRLSLGWSREDAIWEIAKRVPLPAINQFASAVSQAEKRGTPLARVLTTQAEVMRTQRSRAVEQAAARAAVLILGPLMLIFICVFIIILGPFVIRYMRGELF
jgi:tight adherence protein C